MRIQLLREDMVKQNEGVERERNRDIQDYGEGPAEPTGINSRKLKAYHQHRANGADHNELPRPVLEKLQLLVVQTHRARLEKSHRKRVMDLPSFDSIRHYVLAYGNVEISIHHAQELSHHLREKSSFISTG